MNLLSLVPARLPLIVPTDALPFKYILKAEQREHGAATFLLAIWGFGAIFILYLFTHPLALINGYHDRLVAGLGALAIIAVALFFATKIKRQYAVANHGVSVIVSPDKVQVFGGDAGADWQCPLSQYSGLVATALGERTIGHQRQQVIALILQHEDETHSVPVIMVRASQWQDDWPVTYAAALDIPLLTEKRPVCGR